MALPDRESRPLTFRGLAALAPGALAGAAVLAVLSAALSLAPFVFLYRIALEVAATQPDVEQVRTLALYALVAILIRWTFMAASHALAHQGAFSVLYQLRLRLTQQLGRVPMSFFSGHDSGSLRKTVLDDTGALEGFLAHMLPDAVAAAAVPILALGLLFTLDWRLTLAALSPLPVALLLQAFLQRCSARQMREWQALQTRISSQIVEYLRAIPVVKVFGLSARSFGDFGAAVQGAVRWVEHYAATSSAGWAMFVALLAANLVIVAPLGAWLHARGEIDAATFVLFLLVAPVVLQPLLRLTFAFGEQMRRREALARIDDVLRAPVLSRTASRPAVSGAGPPSIEFDDVRFTYREADSVESQALAGVSFTAPTGRLTALVGPSGAGKSTVVRLLPRFFEVAAGAVRVAGRDVRDWPPEELLAQIGIVFQDVFLFHGTVRENLLLARPAATDEQLLAAASAARAHEFIQRLPQGYDTPLGERGARLSGGERQRLSIARAILKDAPILLLDEATAHADAENEWLIRQALVEMCRDRTVLMIAHRLQSVREADHIVVLDGGCVVGQGRHERLLEDCPLYRQLWRDQQSVSEWTLGAAAKGRARDT